MEITRIEFRDCWLRDLSDTEYRFGGKIQFEFTEGERVSRIEIECGVTIANSTPIKDARRIVIKEALDLLSRTAALTPEEVEGSAIKWDRWTPENEDQELIVNHWS